MPKITEKLKKEILEDVQREFPGDEMMQELHFLRQITYHETKDLSEDERIRYIGGSKRKKA